MRNYHVILFLLCYIGAFAVSAWAGYYFYADYTMRTTHKHQAAADEAQRFQSDIVYVDLPRIAVQLPSGTHTGNIRMEITLEVDDKYAAKIQGDRPRIADQLVNYAQTLNYDDLTRPKSTLWLKPDLLQEIKKVTAPTPIHDIMLRQLIIL